MKWNKLMIIFIIQIFIASLRYMKTCKCKNVYNFIILFLHHLLDVLVFFGIFFIENKTENMYHLILISLIMLHWFTNNYRCELTVYLNNLCKEDEDTWLYSIVYHLHKYTNIYYLHTFWIVFLIFYNLIKLR